MNSYLKSILATILFSLLSVLANAQAANTKDTMTVLGSCGQCKTRIEEAAYIKGVKHAAWNKTTKLLTVVYNSKKTSMSKVAAAVTKVGHDTANLKADDKEYAKLPSCCAYRTGSCDHE